MDNPNKRRKADDPANNESKRVKRDPSLTDAAKMSRAEGFAKAVDELPERLGSCLNKRSRVDDPANSKRKRVKFDPSLTVNSKTSKAEMSRKATGILLPSEAEYSSGEPDLPNLHMRCRTSASARSMRHTVALVQFEAKSKAAEEAIVQAKAKWKEAEEAVRAANVKSKEADEAIAQANAKWQQADEASNKMEKIKEAFANSEAFANFEAKSQEIAQSYVEWQTGAQARQGTAEAAFLQAQAKVKATFEAFLAAQKNLKDDE